MGLFLSLQFGWVEVNIVINEFTFKFALESYSQTAKTGDTIRGMLFNHALKVPQASHP